MATDQTQASLALGKGPVGPDGDVLPQLSFWDLSKPDLVRQLELALVETAVDVGRHRTYLDDHGIAELFSELACFRTRLAYLARKSEAMRRGMKLNAKPQTTTTKTKAAARQAANGRYGSTVPFPIGRPR